jgi:CheY-like chemotaxis protein
VVELAVARIGPDLLAVTDGQQALDILATEHFDLILMDMQMPVLNGLQATQAIRQLELESGWTPTPVVAFTANVLDADRRECLDAGMNDFLSKPLDFAELSRVLRRWLPSAGTDEHPANRQLAAERSMDVEKMQSVLRKLFPLLDQSMFDAIPLLHELQAIAAGDPVQAELDAIVAMMDKLDFDATAIALRELAQRQAWAPDA